MIPQDDLDLKAYLYEFLRTNKYEEQNSTFWFPTLETPGKPEDNTPLQTRILNELNELKDKEKLNPQESTESRNKILKGFDWTDTFLVETEKQATEEVLNEYHDSFARHRMDNGMNTEFKVKIIPKDDKAVYNQCHSMNWLYCTEMESSQYCPFPSTRVPSLQRGSPTEKYVSLWISAKSTV